MVQRDDITEGRLLRLLSNCLDVPAGTLATVETVTSIGQKKQELETLTEGNFYQVHLYSKAPK